MPDWLHNALFGAILIVMMVVLAAIPFGVAMTFGLAWAILPRDRAGGDYVNARRIINGTDKAAEIAAHAVKFEKAMRS